MFPFLLSAAAAGLAVPASPEAAAADLRRSVHTAIAAAGPIVTPADRAFVRAKCGGDGHNIRIEQDALHCPDGRVVRGPEVAAMSARISTRAHAVSRAALKSAAVARAQAAVARAAAARARQTALEARY